ncbi:hypothetical protein EDD15DRAFT_2462463 [Pisolithus albus]|nr:hypothetical protein EDD15DRAFT_2462463 [Pisolithus albus]
MDPESEFPGFELSGDFLTITAPGIRLKIATWIAKDFDADKTPESRFVWLGRVSEAFIKSEELEARYGSKTNKATWDADLKLDKAQCKLWQRYGGEPFPGDRHHLVFSQITAIRSILPFKVYINQWKADILANRPSSLPDYVYNAYSDIWKVIADSADKFSGAYVASTLTDFNFRFYQGPITPPVDIVFSPLVDWIDETKLQELLNDVLKGAQGRLAWPDSFNVSTMSKDDANKSQTLATFSINPLGYFRTLISPSDLTRLVNAQTEAAVAGQPQTDWIHPFPPPDEVKKADDSMKKLPSPPVRQEYTVTSMAIKASTGGARVRANRTPTQTIMGGLSANKWALDDLGWKLSKSNLNDTVAEWLHRSAFSLRALGGATNENPDTRPNLMFGTQETNTNMLRSESAIAVFHGRASKLDLDPLQVSEGKLITQVLGTSGKVQVLRPDGTKEDVTVPPELVWGPTTGYLWLVPELEYTISFTIISTREHRSVQHKTAFRPFHRQPALRPESSLDTKVINYFFDQVAINVAPPMVKKPKPSTSALFSLPETPIVKPLVRVARDTLIAEGGHTGPPVLVYSAQPASASTVARSDGNFASSRTHPLEPIHHAIWEQVTSGRNFLVIESAPAGGPGGQPWDDSALAGQPIRAIRINYNGGIDRIQVQYGDTWGDGHGRDVLNQDTFTLQDNEVIIKVEGRAGVTLHAIQFFTNTGRSSPQYGGNGGTPFVWTGPRLAYFSGRAGDAVDNLQANWSQAVKTTSSRREGGLGGQPWSDESPHGNFAIRGIRINFGHGIDRIQVLFGTSTWGASHGQARLEDFFSLDPDEYITRIEGRSGQKLDAVQFFTNTGRSSRRYGGSGGNAFTWTGDRLLHFNGRAGDSVDALQAVWEIPTAILVPSHPLHLDIGNRKPSQEVGGGPGSNPFNDTSFAPSEMRSIIISVLSDVISCIQIEYSPGGRAVHGDPNLEGSVTNTLTLNPGEYITRIQGLSDTRVVAIQFTTNLGRTSPRWGGSSGQIFDWSGAKLLYFAGTWSPGGIHSLQSHWAQTSRKTGIKISNPVCLPAADIQLAEVPGGTEPHPPLDGFVLQGETDLFGVSSLTARFTSWQGPPPPTVSVPKDVIPAYHQAEINSLRVTSFLPLLANTPWADFELNQVLVIFQNAQFDPTRTIGWHLEAGIIIDERYGKVHDALVNFFHIPNDAESLRLRARAALGPQHRWDTLPSMSGFCLEGVLDLAPKQGSKATGISLGTDIMLSKIGVRLLGVSSQELGLQARQKMDYGFGMFGTIHIAVSGSTVPLQLEFEVTDMGHLVQIKADLSGALWQNVFGSGLTLSNVLFSTMFDASALAHSYQFDLSAELELASTIIELSGHYAAGGDYSLTAFVEELTTTHILEIYTHLTNQSITMPSGFNFTMTSGSISISKAGFIISVDDLEIADGKYSCKSATLAVSPSGLQIEGYLGDSLEFDDISLKDVTLKVDIVKAGGSWSGSFMLGGTISFSNMTVDAVVHLYKGDTADDKTNKWDWTVYGHFASVGPQAPLGDLIHATKGTFLENVTLTDAVFIAASRNDPEVSNLNPQRYTIRRGVQICAVVGHIDPFSKLTRQSTSPVLILNASWTSNFGFLLDILLPTPFVIHLGRGITTDPIALRIQTNPVELMIHAGIKVPVAKSPEPLDFQASLSLQDEVVTVSADMYGWWVDPFGISEKVKIGPHINLGLDIDLPLFFATGLPSGFRYGGGLAIGTAEAEVEVDISEDPLQELMKGELKDLGIDDLVAFASSVIQHEIPPPPDFLEFQELKLYMSTGVAIGTENYPAGFSFDAHLIVFGSHLDVSAGITGGVLSANADIDRLHVGPITIQGHDGKKASFALHLGASAQHLEVDGGIEFLGLQVSLLLKLDILPHPSFFFSFLLAFTDLLLFKVEATAGGSSVNLKDLSNLDFALMAEFDQHILEYVRKQLIDALEQAKRASDDAIEEARKKVEAAKKQYEADIEAAQTQVNKTYARWQVYSNNQRAEAQRIRDEYSTKLASLQKAVDDEREAFTIKLKQAEGDLQHANAHRAAEMQKAQAAVVKAQNDWDSSVRRDEAKLEDAKRVLREKFGSAERDLQHAEDKVNSLQNQINDIEHTIRDYANAHWYEVWKKAAIPGLETAKGALYVAKGVADGILEGCKAIVDGTEYVTARDAIPLLESTLEETRKAGDAAFRAAQLAVHDVDVATQALINTAVNALHGVQNGGDFLWKEAEKALAKFVDAGKAILAGAQKILDDLETAAEWVAYQAATAALSVARASTHALDIATESLKIAEHGIDGAFYITEEMVRAITSALDITRITLNGSYNAIARGGQFDALILVTIGGKPREVRIKFRIGSVSDFVHDL